MISRWIGWCAQNRFLVLTGTVLLVIAGVLALRGIPLDALPDISDAQVIVRTEWPGQPPSIIEDQVTYPIVSTLLAAPYVKAVRAQTMFGDSYVFVVFQDGTDIYWARSRVLEYMQQVQGRLPQGARPTIGPDATGVGWVFQYALVDHSGKHTLADLRSLQDWYVRYQLETVPGVAEVATIGGFVRQYQVQIDPDKLRAFNIPLSTVIDRVRASTNEVGGRVLEVGGAEYMIRGLGYVRKLSDLENIPVATKNGTPVLVGQLGTVGFGPDIRQGVADWQGEGEAVGGIVVMRYGMNALNVINGVKEKLAAIRPSLPAGVEIETAYDRSGLILDSIGTLRRALMEEAVVVSVVILIFLFHVRSALIPILILPIAVVASFIPMYYLRVSSNIMSLGGLALAIGVLVDAAIVMVENGYRHLSEHQLREGPLPNAERKRILMDAARQVGPAIFFSLLIIVISFLPVFLLEAQEGRMFRPLAWTKTLAVGFSSLLAVSLVPALMILFIRGRLIPESRHPISRITQAIYLPVLRLCLRFRKTTLLLNLIFLVATLPLALRIGSQFMPPLYEGSALYMPTSLPGISIAQASQLLQQQDRVIRSFSEVLTVQGTVGRSDSATDNAPLDMYDTTIMLKPREQWRPGMTYERLIQEMDAKLQFPGLSNTWTMPVQNRLDMTMTGIKTPLGIKVQGPTLDGIQQLGAQIQTVLSALPEVRSSFAERVSQGFYLNIDVDRAAAARYGLTIADVQQAVASGIGGETVAENIEGRERYPISVRYSRDFRDRPEELRRVLLATPTGAQIPIGDVASISFSRGPSMIRDEDGALTGYVYIDLRQGGDYGGFVGRAEQELRQKLSLPAGYTYKWSGQYEFQLRARQRLQLIVPIVFFAIFLLLYMVFHSVAEATILIFPTLYALTGGLILQRYLGYNFSVAVWVGYIALFGIAVETGVVMVVYLHEALDRRLTSGAALGEKEIEEAAIEGAVHRLRPKLMTVSVVLASLVPLMWSTGVGADVMKPIAAPIVGGMITSTVHVLILVPVFFVLMKERAWRRGTLRPSGVDAEN